MKKEEAIKTLDSVVEILYRKGKIEVTPDVYAQIKKSVEVIREELKLITSKND